MTKTQLNIAEMLRKAGRKVTVIDAKNEQEPPSGGLADLATQIESLLKAAKNADWVQVVGNGGPPCFHLENDRFCLRAERWGGHLDTGCSIKSTHDFVSLESLLKKILLP